MDPPSPNGLTTLIQKITDANANITAKFGNLSGHIESIINAANALLNKLKEGNLTQTQLDIIKEKLEELKQKTFENIGAKNTRIGEIERVFDEIMRYLSSTAANRIDNFGDISDPYEGAKPAEKYEVATGNNYEKEKAAREKENAARKLKTNIETRMIIKDEYNKQSKEKQRREVYEALHKNTPIVTPYRIPESTNSPEVQQLFAVSNQPFLTGAINDSEIEKYKIYVKAIRTLLESKLDGFTFDRDGLNRIFNSPIAKDRLERILNNPLTKFKIEIQQPEFPDYIKHGSQFMGDPRIRNEDPKNITRRKFSEDAWTNLTNYFIELDTKLNPSAKKPLNIFEPSNPLIINADLVLQNINEIPDSTTRLSSDQDIKIKDAITSLKTLLEQTDSSKNKINAGLLDYVNTRYNNPPNSYIGEMANKHKPVLKYIVSLTNKTIDEFKDKILTPIGIFTKSDIRVRNDILISVVSKLTPEEKTEYELNDTNTTITQIQNNMQLQQGGRYKNTRKNRMACGCGIKFGGRRTLKKGKSKSKNKRKSKKQTQTQTKRR